MAISNFTIGNTVKYNMTFTKESDNTPIDVSNWVIIVTFKEELEDPDSKAIIQEFFTLPADATSQAGQATIVIPSDVTDNFKEKGTYFYSFKRVIAGTPPDVYTLEQGKVKIDKNVSSVTEEHVFVPDVYNKTSVVGQADILAANLTIGTITNEASTAITTGNVIRTSPAKGEYIPVGSAVDLVISS